MRGGGEGRDIFFFPNRQSELQCSNLVFISSFLAFTHAEEGEREKDKNQRKNVLKKKNVFVSRLDKAERIGESGNLGFFPPHM